MREWRPQSNMETTYSISIHRPYSVQDSPRVQVSWLLDDRGHVGFLLGGGCPSGFQKLPPNPLRWHLFQTLPEARRGIRLAAHLSKDEVSGAILYYTILANEFFV